MAELVKRVYSLEVSGYDDSIRKFEALTIAFKAADEAKRKLNESLRTSTTAGDSAEVAKLTQQIAALTRQQSDLQKQIESTRKEYEALAAAQRRTTPTGTPGPAQAPVTSPTAPIPTPTVQVNQYAASLAEVSQRLVENRIATRANQEATSALLRTISLAGSATDQQIATLTTLRQEQSQLRVSTQELGVQERNLIKDLQNQDGAIVKLAAQLNLLRSTYDRLSETERNAAGGQAQLSQIQQLDTALKALDAQQGRFQRNVGDYKQQYNGLNLAVQQILRETPSAAVSLNTFFLAISNNLPQLFDELTKTTAKNKEFKQGLEEINRLQQTAVTAQQAAAGAADQAEQSLSAQLETVIGSITASKEQALALKEQVLATVSAGTATVEQAEATAINTEAQLVNAGATAEDAAAIRGLIIAQGQATVAATAATVALEAQTVATAEATVASAAAPGVLRAVASSIFSFNTLLTLGVLALTLFGGKIVDFVGELIKGKPQVDDFAENLKNLNTVIADSSRDAASQITTLKALYTAATDTNIPFAKRIEYVQQLKKEFPEYFGNLKNEAVLNGLSKDSYDRLSASILESSKARAAKSKIDGLAAQQLELDFQRQKVINANDAELVRAAERNRQNPNQRFTDPATGNQLTFADFNLITLEKRKAALEDIADKDAALQRQIDFLTRYAGGQKAIADSLVDTNKVVEKETKDHADRLSAADQNAFKEIDRLRALALANREREILELRQANAAGFAEEQAYLLDVAAINQKAVDSKRAYLASKTSLNREEALTDAELAKERVDIALKTQQQLERIRKEESDRLKAISDEEFNDIQNAIQRRRDIAANDPNSSAVDRLQAEAEYLSGVQALQVLHFNELREIESRFSQDSTKENQKRADALLDTQAKLNRNAYDLDKARLDAAFELIKAQGSRELAELRRQTLAKVTAILDDPTTTNAQKKQRLADLERAQTLAQYDAELADLYRQQARKGIALAEYEKLEKDIVEKQIQRRKFLSDGERTYVQKVADDIKGAINNITGFFRGQRRTAEENARELGRALETAVGTVKAAIEDAYQAYFQRQADRIESERDTTKERLDREQDIALGTAQSEAEKESVRRQFAAKAKEADKKAAEERRALALKQLAIDTAVAVGKTLASYPFPFSLIPVAGLLVAAALQRNTIASQKFAAGGPTGKSRFAPDETGQRPVGIVHEDEWVAPRWMNNHPRYSRVIAGLENVRRRGYADGGYVLPGDNLRAPSNPGSFLLGQPSSTGIEDAVAGLATYTEQMGRDINARIDRIRVINNPNETVGVAGKYAVANKVGVL